MSNVAFNNVLFSQRTLPWMTDKREKTIDPTAQRLYLAARELCGVSGQTALASLLFKDDPSPQRLNNWEKRGVSAEGAITAEKVIGCRAAWIMDGEGPMTASSEQKGAFIKNPDSLELEILGHIQHLLRKDKEKLLAQVAEQAKERDQERQELLEQAGLHRIRAAARGKPATSRVSVEPAQGQLELDANKKR